MDSGSVTIIDTGRRNAKGQAVREVLIDILNEFPRYELQSEAGSEAAIRDIESRLSGIASFGEDTVDTF